jgi:hypothetical protein
MKKDNEAMQSKSRPSQPSGTHSLARDVPLGHFARRKPTKADKTAGGKSNHYFLNKVFRPIRQTRFNQMFSRKNFDYLYKSARNYSTLLGSSFDFPQRKKDFLGLFNRLESLIPNDKKLFLIEKDEKLSFKISYGDDFLVRRVIFIPIEILNKTEGKFRDILLSFFQHFQLTHHFPEKEYMYDYDVVMNNYFDEWDDRKDDPDTWNFLKAYKEGYIHDTFSLIYQKPHRTIDELAALIEQYSPKNISEENLLTTIHQGIDLIKTEKSIFSYRHRPEKDDDNFCCVDDDYMIDAERLIRFVYANDDDVTDNYMEYLNCDCENFANEYFPSRSLHLTPDINALAGDGFVESFFTWLYQFHTNLYDYESK